MDPFTIGLTALAAGSSYLSSSGAQKSSAKQQRLQMMEDNRVRYENQIQQQLLNERRRDMGMDLLGMPEHESVHEVNHVDIPGFMAAGIKAGYNPVTWLQSGALSMFNNKQTIRVTHGHNAADAYKLMMPDAQFQTPSQIQRQPSQMEAIGGALSAGVNTFSGLYKAEQSRAFQTSLLDRQLNALGGAGGSSLGGGLSSLSSSGMQWPISFGGGTASGSGGTSRTGGLSLSKSIPLLTGAPYPDQHELGKVERTNPGTVWMVAPGWTNAQGWEDYGGEAAGFVYGAIRTGNDIALNVTGTDAWGGMQNWWNGRSWSGAPITSRQGVWLRNYAQWLAPSGSMSP